MRKLLWVFMISLAPAAWSSDVVYLSAEGNPQGHIRIVGEGG